jgi:hypothetical protein
MPLSLDLGRIEGFVEAGIQKEAAQDIAEARNTLLHRGKTGAMRPDG